MSGLVFLNDRLVEDEGAAVGADDRGLLYGDGLFETLRVYRGRPFRLPEHLPRMRNSSRESGIAAPPAEEIARAAASRLARTDSR